MLDQTQRQQQFVQKRPAFYDFQPTLDDFRAAAVHGLSQAQKALPCRFLYDAQGSALFDKICDLPEYYPTRTETSILRSSARQIAALAGAGAQVIELGSGSSTKIRILLDAFLAPGAYIPIDISAQHLRQAAQAVQDDYPDLQIGAICADYSKAFDLPDLKTGRRVGFYPGSTIGNLDPGEAKLFLAQWARRLGEGAAMIVGVDLRKSTEVLEAAYNDRQGVTAAFTLNILARANRELGADFNLGCFQHEARYLEDEGRIAIHLRSLRDQQVSLAGRSYHFAENERIHVEDSWKYSIAGFRALATSAGFAPTAHWVDDSGLFSVHLLTVG